MRAGDSENTYFEIDRRILATEKDIVVLSANISDLRSTMKEEQNEVKDAIKALATSQTQQATSLAKIESGINTLAKALTIAIPLIGSIFAAFWAYNLNVIGQIKDVQSAYVKGVYK
jgi:hypothetical protein